MSFLHECVQDVSKNFFKIFNAIPTEIKNTVPTFVDCRALVQTA